MDHFAGLDVSVKDTSVCRHCPVRSAPAARAGASVKPAVRNDREDRGNVGIIRSPVRASIPPDQTGSGVCIAAESRLRGERPMNRRPHQFGQRLVFLF